MKKKKVLVIDDDADVLDIMEEALKYEGFSVMTSNTADDLVTLINNYKPDILLIDYLLKGINGGDICHQVKVTPQTSQLPVIIFSAYPRVLLSLGNYGCDKFIPKPFDLTDLVGNIKTILSAGFRSTKPAIY
ncbi:response regulator [Mucilaginibacter sp. AK015]|uniref:response regulator n=1 Tax=Mucilaginibacter sp. AK015 TaxID=2723072 RepID=UPI00160EB82D|nr:response regulator [Mucilaginibacter sp. AK015]MBB5394075.1 DNA-binding response OmpR family regulator [Mucilaginibacter sp. AK015]